MVLINRGPASPLPLAQTPRYPNPEKLTSRRNKWLSPSLDVLSSAPLEKQYGLPFYPAGRKNEGANTIAKTIYAVAIVSWIALGRQAFGYGHLPLMAELSVDTKIIQAQIDHLTEDSDKVASYVLKERKLLNKLKRTRTALDHELRMVSQIESSTGSRMKTQPKNSSLIKGWLTHRKDSLQLKIHTLQRYLQANSRNAVTKHYGPGPYRVKFSVDLKEDSGKRMLRDFLVETAPLQLMPNAIHLFLDMIDGGVWDNTVFLHHEDVEHVLAAAPVDYATQKVKHRQINSLGWVGLGYPEYKSEYPHTQYTLGFAGQGPTFYINTLDNSVAHGPGRQDHHLLPTDADPCFAKVVEGVKVIEDLVRFGMHQKKVEKGGQHPWADDEHTWTHIVSAKIV